MRLKRVCSVQVSVNDIRPLVFQTVILCSHLMQHIPKVIPKFLHCSIRAEKDKQYSVLVVNNSFSHTCMFRLFSLTEKQMSFIITTRPFHHAVSVLATCLLIIHMNTKKSHASKAKLF
jgi:hypothetical protein